MSFVLGVLALICLSIGVYLLAYDADLIGQFLCWWNQFLDLIESTNHPYSKGILFIVVALILLVLALVFRKRHVVVNKS